MLKYELKSIYSFKNIYSPPECRNTIVGFGCILVILLDQMKGFIAKEVMQWRNEHQDD